MGGQRSFLCRLLSVKRPSINERKLTLCSRNLAYINPDIYHGDNGRVLGFDNSHGYHHRHCMSEVKEVEFVSHDATQERFQQDWLDIVNQTRGKKS